MPNGVVNQFSFHGHLKCSLKSCFLTLKNPSCQFGKQVTYYLNIERWNRSSCSGLFKRCPIYRFIWKNDNLIWEIGFVTIFFLDSGCNSFPFNHSSPLYGNYSTWLQTLNFYTTDTQLIALFGKSLVAFYLLVVFCVFVHVMITYFINKDLWFKYFPPGDDPAKQSSGQGNFGPRLDLWRPYYILQKKKP